jgi:hypothetical protein
MTYDEQHLKDAVEDARQLLAAQSSMWDLEDLMVTMTKEEFYKRVVEWAQQRVAKEKEKK